MQPNPAGTDLFIKLENSLIKKIELIDLSGKIILQQEPLLYETTVKLTGISNGIYLCKIENDNNIISIKKVIILH
ncbi:T9SS type A sorting domain-containing protein [Flavobacterium sp.]|uniref:T9SS type A sorting domain-containing protein n=1 Tax=Flavobacterium sp. TaxID=239 RepID=UPI0037506707